MLNRGCRVHLIKVAVEVVNRWLPIEAKVTGATALQDERSVKQGECVGRGAMYRGADGDAPLAQAPHDRHHLQASHQLVQCLPFRRRMQGIIR